MIRRKLGRTDAELSVIGFGGIVVKDTTAAGAAAWVGEAIDSGINYYDVAPSYGNAEEMLGPALAPYRDQVFLACKTHLRDQAGAAAQLRESLAKLQTDHFDLFQLHALTSEDDIRQAFGPGGAFEAVLAAREAGLVRYLGFSAHSEYAALEAMARHDFDSILFPINYWNTTVGGFAPRVLEVAEAKGVARLALKAMAHAKYDEGEARPYPKCWYQPLAEPALARAAIRWTLAQGVTAAVTPSHGELMRLAVRSVEDLRPPTDEDLALLRAGFGQRQPVFAQ